MIPRRILGLDILPGSSPGKGARYAAAVLIGDKIVAEYEDIGLREIAGIVEKYGVEAIALDNIYELAEDEEGVALFLKQSFVKIPRLIQTTRIGGETYSIEALCRAAGLCRGKPSPLETARINAMLARRGIGSEILLFEEETRITVSRGRQPGQGGMSRERYKRNIELLVLRKTREIKEKLSKARIDYDLFVRRSGAGLEGATFIVYARREKLYGLVKQSRGYDIVVELEPVRREKIGYVPLQGPAPSRRSRPGRPLIVGVDPGMSTGIAVLDIRGRPLFLATRRWIGRNQLAELLHEYGSPVIVATDVNPPPSYVRKLAASLNAKLYYPPRSLSVEEKREAAAKAYERLGVKAKDSHQRDALAAALKAFQHYKVKFEQVEREAERLGLSVGVDEAKLLVLKGTPVSEAIEKVLRSKLRLYAPPPPPPVEHEEGASYEGVLQKYREALIAVTSERDELSRRLRELEEELRMERRLREQFMKMRSATLYREREYAKLRGQLESLRGRLAELEEEKRLLEDKLELYETAVREVYLGEKRLVPRLAGANLELLEKTSDRSIAVDDISVEEIGYGKIIRILKNIAESEKVTTVLLGGREARRLEQALSGLPLVLAHLPEDAVSIGDFYIIDPRQIRRIKRDTMDIKEILLAYREKRRRELLARRPSRG